MTRTASPARSGPVSAGHDRQPAPLSDAQKAQRIRTEVGAAGERMRAHHPWLRHQDAIGLAIQLGAIAGMGLCAWAYLAGWAPWWAVMLPIAIFASFTHEIEHDLIHQLYFKNRPWVQDVLLFLGWCARPSTVNPWIRRQMHFHHHKHSGQATDYEERAITNGQPWGLKRFLMTSDTILSYALRRREMLGIMKAYVKEVEKPATRAAFRRGMAAKLLSLAPLGMAFWAAWHLFLGFHAIDIGARLVGSPVAWSAGTLSFMDGLQAWVVCLILPNVLRNFALHFISSNMHYYGNVERGNLLQQCQVLNHPLFWPFQLLCFNFGSTHAIHHFVVGQPFYLRQMIAGEAHQIMRRMGVPFNDLGTFGRANRREARGVAPA